MSGSRILWSPSGEGNIRKAAYLDVFQSVHILLEKFKADGYRVELPDRELYKLFEEMAIVNSGTWFRKERTLNNCFSIDLHEYLEFFHSLTGDLQEEIIHYWGDPPGSVMSVNNKILTPGIKCGNIFVGIQPARPPLDGSDLTKASHDKTKPLHHQYLAFYFWLQKIWCADMVFHVGTHGLAEFMKGKEVGMSKDCFPDILIGDMPHLYIYHVLNTSESTIAKRRLYGTMISYNSPPFTTSDLYEDYTELQDLIDEYSDVAVQNPHRKDIVQEKILEMAATTNAVSNWIWSSIAKRFVFDEEMRKRLIENNKFAAADIMKRLFEAEKRGYWEAADDEMETLRRAYLDAEGEIEDVV